MHIVEETSECVCSQYWGTAVGTHTLYIKHKDNDVHAFLSYPVVSRGSIITDWLSAFSLIYVTPHNHPSSLPLLFGNLAVTYGFFSNCFYRSEKFLLDCVVIHL